MPGNHRSGRRRATTQEHKRNGTFKPSRHGGRGDELDAERPAKPKGLLVDADALWDVIVEWLVQHGQVQRIDAASLELMCRLWGLARTALAAAEENPLDKNARVAAVGYAQRFESISSRFGLTPVDRARLTLRAAESSGKPEGKERFFGVVG